MNIFNGSKALNDAISSENDDLVFKLINECTNINYCGPNISDKFVSFVTGCYEYYATPLTNASRYGHIKYLKALVDAGADINQHDFGGWNALLVASIFNYPNFVIELLGYPGVVVDCTNKRGRTSLMFCVENNMIECVKILIDKGADVNKIDMDKCTALMYASYYGYTECTKILIEADANIYNVSKSGFSALTIATENKHTECIKVIKEQMIKDFKFLPLCNDIVRIIVMEYI